MHGLRIDNEMIRNHLWNPGLYKSDPNCMNNLSDNVAQPNPCIWMLKGRSLTLAPSFFSCLWAASALLRFLLMALSLFAVWQPPHHCSSLKIRPLPVLWWHWLGFYEDCWAYLGLFSLAVALFKPSTANSSSFVSVEVFLETLLDVWCAVNPFLPFCRRFRGCFAVRWWSRLLKYSGKRTVSPYFYSLICF